MAHRGSSEAVAEHTLGAYARALDEGSEALECDVRLTADGHLVCVHDRRVDRTTNARGVVSAMTLRELDELDATSWKHPWLDLDDEAELPDRDHSRVLTLRRLLQMVADYDRVVDLAIETKHPTRYAGLVERRLVEVLAEFGWAGAGSPVRVMSFAPTALTRVQRAAPELEVVLLVEHAVNWSVLRGMLAPGWIVGVSMDLLRRQPRISEHLHRSRRRLHVFVVNTAEDLRQCLDAGAEAVITDRPGWMLAALEGV